MKTEYKPPRTRRDWQEARAKLEPFEVEPWDRHERHINTVQTPSENSQTQTSRPEQLIAELARTLAASSLKALFWYRAIEWFWWTMRIVTPLAITGGLIAFALHNAAALRRLL